MHPGDSVLSVLNSADTISDAFAVSNVQEFSFGKYLKCLTDLNGEQCDNWQYVVNSISPVESIDQKTLSGGENIYIYFGPQNKITLNASNITTADTLTATTQKYDYGNNAWIVRSGVTVGLTQPNPEDAFNPIEIQTLEVDENGRAIFPTIPIGTYNVGVKDDYYFPTETLTVIAPPIPESRGHHSSSRSTDETAGKVLGTETKAIFDLKKAFDFLITEQKDNGSFVGDLYTDWTAVALGSTPDYKKETIKLIKYFQESEMESPLLTDYERHAMALMALGLNPYNTNGQNYIEKIVSGFDGIQFGNPHEDNDDIFALIVLQNAGYGANDKMISDDIAFILKTQKENGSFDNSVDMTGAGMEALSTFGENEQVKIALEKAKNFLKLNQKNNGGWNDNASSTAWALEGIMALGEKSEDWKNGENTPFDYLVTLQDIDGGIKNEDLNTKIWETAYVTSVFSGKTWNQVMQKFEKPKIAPRPEAPKKIAYKKQLTVPVINTLTESPAIIHPETPPKSWFASFFENIFGF
jgi:hypothetical protein